MLERTRRLFRLLGLELDHVWHVIVRVAVGCYNDGLIHAGNLAYMSMLAIFPFFVTGAAVFSAFGEDAERMAAVSAVLTALPPLVSDVIGPVAKDVVELRSGALLWIGGVVGLWTAGSLMETIRDILRRAYGTEPSRAFWWYRLFSTGFILLVMFLLMLSLFVQVTIGTAMQVISANLPELSDALGHLAWSRIIPMLGLFGSIYLVFYTLTPRIYRLGKSPKWPGALLVTLWWAIVSELLPRALRQVFSYDLTYGSLAGIIITLFFFWLVGLGMVAGAELNAALANPLDKEAGGEAKANRDATKLEEIA
jgi:membrane protein